MIKCEFLNLEQPTYKSVVSVDCYNNRAKRLGFGS